MIYGSLDVVFNLGCLVVCGCVWITGTPGWIDLAWFIPCVFYFVGKISLIIFMHVFVLCVNIVYSHVLNFCYNSHTEYNLCFCLGYVWEHML